MRALPVFVIAAMACTAEAGTLTALRTLPAGSVIQSQDVAFDTSRAGGADDPAAMIGKETRVTVYAGRPLLAANLAAPTLVERNQIVVVGYHAGGLSIETEGRALGKGGAGDVIRVLNIASRATLSARINPDGTLTVLTR